MRSPLAALAVVGFVGGLSLATSASAAGGAATAVLKLATGDAIGTVTFTDSTAGVLLSFNLKGLPPGPHAVSIHDVGKCEGDLTSAGAIYNPLGASHGLLHDAGPMAGDLPNVHVGADGTAVFETLSPLLSLSTDSDDPLFDADGASVVISEKPDDYKSGQDGNAGRAIACGVIEIAK